MESLIEVLTISAKPKIRCAWHSCRDRSVPVRKLRNRLDWSVSISTKQAG
jgi:hypothetical protein